MDLHIEFNKLILKKFKVNKLTAPVFYNFPIGIRFEIGVDKQYCEERKYTENCIYRAKSIFEEVFGLNDEIYIVIESFEDKSDLNKDISVIKPLIHGYKEFICFDDKLFEDDEDEDFYKRYLYRTTTSEIDYLEIITQIINTGIGVYIFNTTSEVIYHLYDDRGLDVVASKISSIKHLYLKFNNWILDYDRNKIDSLFIS